jgi:hypothetical protein
LRYLQQFRPWKTIVNNRIILTRGNVHRSDPDLVMVASDEITLGCDLRRGIDVPRSHAGLCAMDMRQ